jgi:hypothetical protein
MGALTVKKSTDARSGSSDTPIFFSIRYRKRLITADTMLGNENPISGKDADFPLQVSSTGDVLCGEVAALTAQRRHRTRTAILFLPRYLIFVTYHLNQ